jgi:hypothetical protein
MDTPIHKLFGLLGSAATAGASVLMSRSLAWMTPAKEFVLFLTAIGGFFGVVFYTLSIALDVRKKWREERAAHRDELREIEDAVCRKRRTLMQCPLYLHENPENCHERDDQNP